MTDYFLAIFFCHVILQGESPLLYYFQERVGCKSFIFILHFVLLRKSVSFYIVVTNPTWASDGTLEFGVLNTQQCLWSDSAVLYLLTLSAFGS